MPDNHYKSAVELIRLIRAKEISPLEVMEESIGRVEALNPLINAFVSLRAEQAIDEAKAMTERIASGRDLGPLAGIPIGVKDLEDVKGMVTSFGSIPYKDNVATSDSIQVARLKAKGAIVLGKTNTPEFGFTAFTKNRIFGVTRNPWNMNHTPGGSSGGSAAAVTGGLVSMATGSDAGGSIRIPASYCGCFGFKPTFGRIPLGPFPLLQMSNLLTFGPLTRTVTDAALYLECVAGYHPADPDSLPSLQCSYVKFLGNLPTGLRIAFSPDLGFSKVKKEVKIQVESAAKCFAEEGHKVDLWEGKLPEMEETWHNLMVRELYSQLQKDIEENKEKLGRALVEAVSEGRFFSIGDHILAQKTKTELNRMLWELFEEFDLLLTPTTPTDAFAVEGPPPAEIDGYPVSLLGVVALTYPFNLSGHPAASVRAGFTANGLPVGLQIIGPRHKDDLVLQMAYFYEQMNLQNASWPDFTKTA